MSALSMGTIGPGIARERVEPRARSFIVSCLCATPAARQRIAAAVRRRGGAVLYVYGELHGLAVSARGGRDPKRFEAAIRRIPGVIQVMPDGTATISTTR